METMILVWIIGYLGFLWISMDISLFFSRVLLGIPPNPRFVEICVGKTLVGIR